VQQKIHVLIANPTRVLRDVLYATVRGEPDIEVDGEVSDEDAVLSAAELTHADCVVIDIGEGGVRMPFCKTLFAANPLVRILAISESADLAAICWWAGGEVRCSYMKASRSTVLAALRSSHASGDSQIVDVAAEDASHELRRTRPLVS
jgi:DNA-binding NarL/FixJ family response regulator